MKAGFDSHERAFQHRQLAFQVAKASTFELAEGWKQCRLLAHWCTWLFWLYLVTALVVDPTADEWCDAQRSPPTR
jgi:hypothetical protein